MDSAIDHYVSATLTALNNQELFNVSSNHTQNIENAEKTLRRATGVVLGIGSITLSDGSALAVAAASIVYNGSKMNRKSEKLMTERLEAEERFLRMGMFADALGVVRNSAKVIMDGFRFLPEVFGPIRMITNIIGIPLKLFLKTSLQNRLKFEKMSGPEQTFEGASLGVYTWKLLLLLEDLKTKVS